MLLNINLRILPSKYREVSVMISSITTLSKEHFHRMVIDLNVFFVLNHFIEKTLLLNDHFIERCQQKMLETFLSY